jgi:toxin ParE1/3/4
MAYRLSRKAESDLLTIYAEGAARFGINQAEAYFTRIERTLELLADHPLMARERPEISPPVRIHPCGKHLIVYLVAGDGILVLRIRHQREDWSSEPA